MAIQWYPGHMTSARKKAEETLEHIDVVIEVLDARVPAASHNPMIEEMRNFRQRPNLKILNKADLADPQITQAWLNYFNSQPNTKAVALSCKKAGDAKKIPGLCRQLAPHRGSPLKPLRMMIMGIPNVGKSTLMNALLNRRAAKVGDEPAVTKSQQRFDLGDNQSITDTPGMMWPKIEHESDGYMLAASHAIGRNAVIDEDVAEFLGNLLLKQYPALINTRYKLDAMKLDVQQIDGIDLLQAIAKRRAYKRNDGQWDMERTAMAFLTDYRGGAIGRVSLESPKSRAEMIALAAAKPEKINNEVENSTEADAQTDAS
ncbi:MULTISPECIES: ribosome biogenesis GTPase YlqF [unclassified Methylophilus]|jgi:ribosome biogenesis GTPase A|uniref:ribosome biogenesis GTPase YlqF n=1 Tax=unclassified Methylophilus TaxID=2630143 RepID=UPI0006F52774|nr:MULTISPECIES: ribosome biogenesis GTPase YlqF [unclassified Methylophilus]KQT37228.1 ribosome biogenesis GTPase YlqF [Methylophilus sp. Leaf416]KQT55602.1 ribosome biogenesis GTPase YlqF [Methylophilus sp. Leaf459]